MKHSWLLRLWYVSKLRQQLNSTFKMKNEVDAIHSNSISEIQNRIEPLWLSVKKLVYKLGIKIVQNNRVRLQKNEIEKISISPNPVFSQNQISKITRKFWINLFIIVLFVVSESFLYYLTASLFVAGGSMIMKISVAIFLALLIMFCLDFGLTQHFLYRKMNSNHVKKEVEDYDLKKQNDLRILGYILILISITAIIFAGICRIYFLENIAPNGLSPEKIKSVKEASKWASWLTLVVTILTAVLLALIKREQSHIAEQYGVLQYWNKTVKRRNEYSQALIKEANKILLLVEQSIEKHWQLVIEIKRIFKMTEEFDERYTSLNQEYLEIKARPGFTMTEFIYRKFSVLQGAHEELFRFGIYQAAEVKDKIVYAQLSLKGVDEYLTEHINAINSQSIKTEELTPTASSNGKTSKTNFQTIKTI